MESQRAAAMRYSQGQVRLVSALQAKFVRFLLFVLCSYAQTQKQVFAFNSLFMSVEPSDVNPADMTLLIV